MLPIYLRTAGFYEYEASIHPPSERDGWQRNNRAISYLHLKGEGKVLVVTDPGGDKRDWGSLVASMRRSERDVEVREAYEFPTEPLSLLPYDCIMRHYEDVISNLRIEQFKNAAVGIDVQGLPSRLHPDKLPTSALAYCDFDLLVLAGQGFAMRRE